MLQEFIKRIIVSAVFVVISTVITYLLSYITGGVDYKGQQSTTAAKRIEREFNTPLTQYESSLASEVVDPSTIREGLDDVGGLVNIKRELMANVIYPLRYSTVFFHEGLREMHVSRGVLLAGPPGTGKTMLARAIAKECGCRFITLSLSNLENKYYGETTKLLAASFSLARKVQPCIMFFDEIDGMLRERSADDQSCVYGFKTEFMNQLDGFTKTRAAVIVLACTNTTQALDVALRRRLPTVYTIGAPSEEERKHIVKLHSKNEQLTDSVIDWVACNTEGFTGSDLLEVYRSAASSRMKRMYAEPSFHESMGRQGANPDIKRVKAMIPKIIEEDWQVAVRAVMCARTAHDYVKQRADGDGERNGTDRLRRILNTLTRKEDPPPAPHRNELVEMSEIQGGRDREGVAYGVSTLGQSIDLLTLPLSYGDSAIAPPDDIPHEQHVEVEEATTPSQPHQHVESEGEEEPP